MSLFSVSVQEEPFDPTEEMTHALKAVEAVQAGALNSFLGLVRDTRQDQLGQSHRLEALLLQHYPQMTQKILSQLLDEAKQRFSLEFIRIIHRYGRLLPHQPIVMVLCACPHRENAFLGTQFLMDRLKTDAPFWKCEYQSNGSAHWVDAQEKDQARSSIWKNP